MKSKLSCVIAALFLAGGCASCDRPTPSDAGPPDADAPDVQVEDADEGGTPDGDEDADADEDGLPAPVPMKMIVVTPDHEGMDCGLGCKQITFGGSLASGDYSVQGDYLIYSFYPGGYASSVVLVDLDSGVEYLIDECNDYWCAYPAISGADVVYVTSPHSDDVLQSIWHYRIGDAERTALTRRRMTDRGRSTREIDLHEDTAVWYDSAVPMAGLYAMSTSGGPVTSLTPLTCPCYAGPRVWGRQVVYQGWQEGFSNVYLVDIDTLEERNLTYEEYELTGQAILQDFPAFDGEWVVWKDSRNDPSDNPDGDPFNSDIYGTRLPFGPQEPLCLDPSIQTWPDVNQGIAVWADFRNAEDPNDFTDRPDSDVDIYMLDLETRVEQQVTSLPGFEHGPRVWGHRVFFTADDLIGQRAVFMVDLEEAGLVAPTP